MEESNSSGEYMHQVSVAQYFYGFFDRLLWMLLSNIECVIFFISVPEGLFQWLTLDSAQNITLIL